MFRRRGGLAIYSFSRNSAAKNAGLRSARVMVRRQYGSREVLWPVEDPKRADIIVGVDGKAVESVDQLLNEVEKNKPGTRVSLNIIRGGERMDVPVTLLEDR